MLGAAMTLGLFAVVGGCSSETQGKIQDAADNANLGSGQGGSGGDSGGGSDTGGGDPNGGGSNAPDVTLPDVTGPPETAPPATAPAATAPPATDSSSDTGLSNEDWLLLAILGVVAFAVIVGATSAATHHSDKKSAARAELNGKLSDIVGGCRWLHDSGSLDVLRQSDPIQLTSAWDTFRGRAVDVEGRISALAAGPIDSNLVQSLNFLGQSVAGLRSALSSNVSLRMDAEATSQLPLVDQSTQTVTDRRRQLDQAVGPVASAMK